MREIKFRAWDTESQKMVYEPYYFDVYHYSDETRANKKTHRYYEDWRSLEDGRGYECEIMQFTGLKDKNGKDIYEGDIIRFNFKHEEHPEAKTYQVEWFKHAWRLDRLWLFTEITSIEVIGNIYENKELLTNGNR